jgi:hypothetical protein
MISLLARLPMAAWLAFLAAGCASAEARRLDPGHKAEVYTAQMKFRFEPGISPPTVLKRIQPGDIITFSAEDDSGGAFTALSAAVSQKGQVGLVYPFMKGKLRVLSADSEQGVFIDTVENMVKRRGFYVYSFPPGLLDLKRIDQFADRAVDLGRLDYDWSGIIGWNSNLTPNTITQIGDEYTDASVVAAALHFAGLSLDRAWRGVVTPGDIIFSPARRNTNGPGSAAGLAEKEPPAARDEPSEEPEDGR